MCAMQFGFTTGKRFFLKHRMRDVNIHVERMEMTVQQQTTNAVKVYKKTVDLETDHRDHNVM